jgi:flavin reductase (DIM6/NTAB) family NADH-FMN oxidoreductase RutF
MFLDVAELSSQERYKLMASTILPRPIALVTSMSRDGVLNAAPFSFFNAVSDDPPAIVIGFQPQPDGSLKDTPRNIRERGEFVVNLVDHALAEQMNICANAEPPEVCELNEASLKILPSEIIEIPRVAASPVSLECKRRTGIDIGQGRVVEVGDVVAFHVRDELIDTEKLHVAGESADLIARMHGADWYARTTDLFRLKRNY